MASPASLSTFPAMPTPSTSQQLPPENLRSTSYAVPRLPRPLPAFSLQPSLVKKRDSAARPEPRIFPSLPLAGDLETLRQQLSQVCSELEKSQAACAEARAEKELLVAERTQIIVSLQSLTALLGRADVLSGYGEAADDAASALMEERLLRLREALPEGNAVRTLCQESELQPHIKSLSKQLLSLREEWRRDVRLLRQAATQAQLEAEACRAQTDRAGAEQQAAAEAAESSRRQVEGLEEQLRQQTDELEGRIRLMRGQAYSQQQETLEAQHEAAGARQQLHRLQQQAREAAQQAQDASEKGYQDDQLQQQRHRVLDLELQLREAERQRGDAERLQQADIARALGSDALLREELRRSREENQRLQTVLQEAEQQLAHVRDDVEGVKLRHLELQGKLGSAKKA